MILTLFYCRFERDHLDGELNRVMSQIEEGVRAGKSEDFEIEAKTVESVFKRINSTKAVGPDNISGRLLKTCASELCDIYYRIFNCTLKECSIPGAWTYSIICPLPKKRSPCTLNDKYPVALTSLVMKCFEKIVVQHLLTFTSQQLDPFQLLTNHTEELMMLFKPSSQFFFFI